MIDASVRDMLLVDYQDNIYLFVNTYAFLANFSAK